jgi:hypothetical protein
MVKDFSTTMQGCISIKKPRTIPEKENSLIFYHISLPKGDKLFYGTREEILESEIWWHGLSCPCPAQAKACGYQNNSSSGNDQSP